MARISTYQHDAMPHADDNVIGTNQSPGHANETVLFRIGAIGELIRDGLVGQLDVDFGREYDALPDPLPADYDSSTFPDIGLPHYTINHNFNTDNIGFEIWILEEVDASDGTRTAYVPLSASTNTDLMENTVIYQIDMNNLRVEFPDIGERFQARVQLTAG